MSFSGQASATLATAATYADKATLIASGEQMLEGSCNSLQASGDEYLFIQGGAAGTDDDACSSLQWCFRWTITISGTLNHCNGSD